MQAQELIADWEKTMNIKAMEKQAEKKPHAVVEGILNEQSLKRLDQEEPSTASVYQRLFDRVNEDLEKKSVYSKSTNGYGRRKGSVVVEKAKQMVEERLERERQEEEEQDRGKHKTTGKKQKPQVEGKQEEVVKGGFPWEKRLSSMQQIQMLRQL